MSYSWSQPMNTSPFSRYGVGEINVIQSSHYLGWSNVSCAFSDPQFLNISNPASYAGLIKHSPLFDVSLSGKSALYRSDYNDTITSSSGFNLGLNNMYLGLPVTKNWGLVIGITPYSSQGYEVSNSFMLDSSNVTNRYTGDGTVNKLFIGNGFNVLNKGDSSKLSIGLNAAYLFGNLENNSSVIFESTNAYNSRIQNRTMISGWNFDAGIQYYKRFRTANKTKLYLRLGATYSLNPQVNTKSDFFAYSFVYNFGVQEIPKDTLEFGEDLSGTVYIPEKMCFGLGFGKNKNDQKVWDCGLQYERTDWSNFHYSVLFSNQTVLQMAQSSTIAFGYRITPTLDWSNSNKSVFSKSTYSLGLHSTQSSVMVNDTSLQNYGINFGISLPLLSSRSFSRVNIGLEFGRLGELNKNRIEENYIKFALGFTMAPDTRYDRWFRKRKYD